VKKYGANVAQERGRYAVVRCPGCKQHFQRTDYEQIYCLECESNAEWEASER
jgi:hypothetical protein